ncbi:salicylate synthase [Streptomyces sp. NPDC050560]|uniref:salicylate synthase n=1 Tax=Streptomyces sp. NPDC050560 TaxID=3365630 RepID=UPI0037B61422
MSEQYRHSTIQGPFDPLATAARVAASGLFAQYVVYEREGHWYLAGDPLTHLRVRPRAVHTDDGAPDLPWRDTPWQAIRTALRRAPVADGNAYGWLAFELASGDTDTDTVTLAHLIVPATELTITRRNLTVRTTEPGLPARLRDVLSRPQDTAPPPPKPVNVEEAEEASGPEGAQEAAQGANGSYRARVARAVAEIGRGALDKVILSRAVRVPFSVDMPATYVAGRLANTPARSFLLDLDGTQAAGFSPETVIEAPGDGTATTQPLAGTRALTGEPERDTALRAELHRDPKEVYEHAMSVRLAVDELSSVGAAGTTRVGEFLTVRERGSVQHLASRVTTDLADGRTAWDALGAVFPPVTASGIPKPAAYRLIRELEDEPRGLYAGAVLRAGYDGSLDAALVLRAVYQRDDTAWLRAGAGIVGASRPDREYEESCEKLRSVAPYLVPREG